MAAASLLLLLALMLVSQALARPNDADELLQWVVDNGGMVW